VFVALAFAVVSPAIVAVLFAEVTLIGADDIFRSYENKLIDIEIYSELWLYVEFVITEFDYISKRIFFIHIRTL
jgi:hypothetical protein